MKTISEVISGIGVGSQTAKEFVQSKRKNVFIKKSKEGFNVVFKHKFFKNDSEKLVEQNKFLNKVACKTEEQAWISSALVLMGFEESLSFSEGIIPQ